MAQELRRDQVKDYTNGQQTFPMVDRDFLNSQANGHRGLLDYYMPKFYDMARGHVVNKYHIIFYGPYVDEALMIMDQNSRADKYNQGRTKAFYDTGDLFRKTLFDQWLSMCYNSDAGTLNMFWAAQSVTIPAPTATDTPIMMDSTKQMTYNVISKVNCGNTLTINVIDDPYLMWYNFFNALFNVQFTPLLLKPRSTLQKINAVVQLYTEGLTVDNSMKSIAERKNGNTCITDVTVGQMFEFNSCITMKAPSLNASFGDAKPYTFQVDLKYPNAFQGTFKDQLRYLRDNTTRGVDPRHVREAGETSCETTLVDNRHSPYGEFNKGFFEVPISTWTADYNNATFEAFRPKEYQRYIDSKNAAFSSIKYHYDMHGNRRR